MIDPKEPASDDETLLMPRDRGEAQFTPEPDDPGAVDPDAVPKSPRAAPSGNRASAMIAAGILLSRIAGLMREAVSAQFLGTTLYADAFRAGLRMPNVLQNLLGEGTLSASFIPVYAELLHEGKKEEAGRVAGAIFALLFAVAGALALTGVLLAPVLTSIFLPGFEGERRELTIAITRIIFPMTGVLVLSAWSLGILNSHRNFFVPYVAPVLWNASIIGALFAFGGRVDSGRLVVAAAWGALLGGVLQFAIQLPTVLKLERSLKIRWDLKLEGVRTAVRSAGPAIMGRGVVQVSSYADIVLASFLAAGAVSTYTYALTLYILPVSLFGMSVAAAELPELSRQRTAAIEVLRERAKGGLQRIAFYVVPSFVAFMLLGDVVVATLYQRGQFTRNDTIAVWLTLMGLTLGLLATTTSRLLSSTFFALRDTKTPARFATVRVVLAIVLSLTLMLAFERITIRGWQLPGGWLAHYTIAGKPIGTLGLALGSGIAAWIEWFLLKRALRARIGHVGAGAGPLSRMFAAALAGAAAGWGVRMLIGDWHPVPLGVMVGGTFGLVYFSIAAMLGLEQSGALFARLGRIIKR
ncbi:MAG TPA: murein biosynthesis integral membrane protein MurJ [Longimicrobium sp.]|jgi:putative peptidoglycan lipid II flippase